ncbi:recombinase family protein [Methylocystis echinoides]|uniref:Resolvase n=1 Tax=Methylocystis echinoides TaxID=29468 RepID=A0A9W6GXN6_9HYPH|nr:recombinase family protein [Methylocystis echinoides]GLI94978.1 resolvase [Methylocystis echinoides]
MAQGNFVAYLRVSTAKQGQSGLGLDAQQRAVESYLNGGDWSLVATFVEIESGKRDDRPKLQEALEACKLYGATLVIARLDRLSRDAHFLLGLLKSGVKFVCCDMPQADSFMVGIMAQLAQKERELISERTKAALQSAKARGVKLGGDRGTFQEVAIAGRVKGNEAIVREADERAERLSKLIGELQGRGLSLNAIARELDQRGIPSARGGRWTATSVRNVLRRLAQPA